METWDARTSRRNVREFSDHVLGETDLERILEAGRRTPSSRNWQPWDFVVVTDPQRLAELAGVWRGAWHVANAKAAVAIIAPVLDTEKERNTLHFDLGQAVMAMMLAAADSGIGTGHAAVADQSLARQILGFPDDRFCAHMISFGLPADKPLRPLKRINRRSFDEVVHRHRW
ncbi:MAG: nitroreductase family protein [Acidimicrobiia bacterium]|nr:nitroreductase family protein [Acidimicrobiia bacterium]